MTLATKRRSSGNQRDYWRLILSLMVILLAGCASQDRFATFQRLAAERYDGRAAESARELVVLLEDLDQRQAATDIKLQRINDFFNQRVAFRDDQVIWGESDYWASPLETLAKGAGDCEDFVIAKFASLRLLDIPLARLRLTYVRLRVGGPSSNITQAHMVLSYYPAPDSDPLVLDNVVSDIRPASQRPDLTPLFSFNDQALWVGDGNKASQYDPQQRMSRWQEVIFRIKDEGL